MSRKAKYTKEVKLKASKDYLSGKVSAKEIARSLGMSKRGDEIVRYWARQYEMNGDKIFDDKPKNKSYSKEFKEKVVKEYLDGKGSSRYLAAKFGIPSESSVLSWVKKYNSHIELEDYDPKGDQLWNCQEKLIDSVPFMFDLFVVSSSNKWVYEKYLFDKYFQILVIKEVFIDYS